MDHPLGVMDHRQSVLGDGLPGARPAPMIHDVIDGLAGS